MVGSTTGVGGALGSDKPLIAWTKLMQDHCLVAPKAS